MASATLLSVKRGRGGVALLPQVFQARGQRGDPLLAGLLARFQRRRPLGQRGALVVAFLFLRGEALDFVNDGVDLLVQQAAGILQRIELALARGDGDFLLAQFVLRLLQAGLQFRLLAQQRAALAAGLGHALLEFGHVAPAVR